MNPKENTDARVLALGDEAFSRRKNRRKKLRVLVEIAALSMPRAPPLMMTAPDFAISAHRALVIITLFSVGLRVPTTATGTLFFKQLKSPLTYKTSG